MTTLMTDAGGIAADLMRGAGVEALLSLLLVMIAMITTAFAIQSAVSLRSEEASGIIEPQLAGALSRTRWATHRLLIPVVGSAVLLLVGGAGMGAGYGSIIGDPSQTGRLALSALTYWPAVMVFVGIAVALFGWLPRLAIPLTWGSAGGNVVHRRDRRRPTPSALAAEHAAVLGHSLRALPGTDLATARCHDSRCRGTRLGWADPVRTPGHRAPINPMTSASWTGRAPQGHMPASAAAMSIAIASQPPRRMQPDQVRRFDGDGANAHLDDDLAASVPVPSDLRPCLPTRVRATVRS